MRFRDVLALAALVGLVACSSKSVRTERPLDPTTSAPAAPTTAAPTTVVPTTIASTTTVAPLVRMVPSSPPRGVVTPNATWFRVTRADGVSQPVAVFRPRGDGSHPVVVYLHGSSGLAKAQLGWVPQLTAAGFIVIIGCYLDASAPGAFVSCPTLPDSGHASASSTRRAYEALLDTASSIAGGQPDHVGVIGVSYGGIAALSTREPRVKAIVADSAYGNAGVQPVNAPVLLLGRTSDPNVAHAKVVAFEQSLRAAHRPVAAHYYAGSGHVATLDLTSRAVASDASARAIAFLRAHLR